VLTVLIKKNETMFVAKSIPSEHKDLIHDVSYDFHGTRMATCSSDQTVKVRSFGYFLSNVFRPQCFSYSMFILWFETHGEIYHRIKRQKISCLKNIWFCLKI